MGLPAFRPTGARTPAGYQATRNLRLQFNVTNLFDKDYVASINRGGHRYDPGAERAYRLTANLDF